MHTLTTSGQIFGVNISIWTDVLKPDIVDNYKRTIPHWLRVSRFSVVISLQSIENVTIEETVLKYIKQKVHVVVLTSDEGHRYYVTGSGTTDPIRYYIQCMIYV